MVVKMLQECPDSDASCPYFKGISPTSGMGGSEIGGKAPVFCQQMCNEMPTIR